MATLTPQEIEQLQQQLKQKTEELRAIYSKLAEAGVAELPDDCLDAISGGMRDVAPLGDSTNAGGAPEPTFCLAVNMFT